MRRTRTDPPRLLPTLARDATSFAPLDAFALRWRFAESPSREVAPHFRDRLRPLTASAAAALASEASSRCADSSEFSITFRSDDSPGLVRSQLSGLDVPADAQIVVWWSASTALLTEWDVFASHWDDFCYPAADDICVWPVAGDWTLCYRRYDVLQFRRAPGTA